MNFFDLHCDTPYECFVKGIPLSSDALAVNFKASRVFERWCQCFAVWIKDDAKQPFELYKNIISDCKHKLSTVPENLTPILTVEGGALIENELGRVERLYADGVRVLTLTWNGENSIAGGVDTDASLTDFGKEVIRELNRFDMLCDLSHLNSKSFFAALDTADRPIITHGCCNAVNPHKRNYTDSQLSALAQKGGIIGLCLYPQFAGEDAFEGIYRNILHLLGLGLEDNIAIGTDFDGAKMQNGLAKTTDIPSLLVYLQQKGLENRLLDKIFYNNAEKIFVSL